MMTEGTQYADLSEDERIMKVEGIRVPHPGFLVAVAKIKECQRRSKLSTEPYSLLIMGEPGSGKTTIYDNYRKNVIEQEVVVEGGTQKTLNILCDTLPSPVTTKVVIERLLTNIGDPIPNAGKTIDEKKERLIKLIKDRRVELIMLDEFHNLLDRDKKKTMDGVSELFKDLLNKTKVPIIMFGLIDASRPNNDSITILNTHTQLDRRIIKSHILHRFSLDTATDRKVFTNVLAEIDRKLPFKKPSNLADLSVANMFFNASGGLMFNVITLIRDAAYYAITEGQDNIELEDLAMAFDENRFINKNGTRDNPFDCTA